MKVKVSTFEKLMLWAAGIIAVCVVLANLFRATHVIGHAKVQAEPYRVNVAGCVVLGAMATLLLCTAIGLPWAVRMWMR